MIDALEAERGAKSEAAPVSETDFVCDVPAEPPERKPSQTIADERTP